MKFTKDEIGIVLKSMLMFSGVPFNLHGKAVITEDDAEMDNRLDEKFVQARRTLRATSRDIVAIDLSDEERYFLTNVMDQILRECKLHHKDLEIHVGDWSSVVAVRRRFDSIDSAADSGSS